MRVRGEKTRNILLQAKISVMQAQFIHVLMIVHLYSYGLKVTV